MTESDFKINISKIKNQKKVRFNEPSPQEKANKHSPSNDNFIRSKTLGELNVQLFRKNNEENNNKKTKNQKQKNENSRNFLDSNDILPENKRVARRMSTSQTVSDMRSLRSDQHLPQEIDKVILEFNGVVKKVNDNQKFVRKVKESGVFSEQEVKELEDEVKLVEEKSIEEIHKAIKAVNTYHKPREQALRELNTPNYKKILVIFGAISFFAFVIIAIFAIFVIIVSIVSQSSK